MYIKKCRLAYPCNLPKHANLLQDYANSMMKSANSHQKSANLLQSVRLGSDSVQNHMLLMRIRLKSMPIRALKSCIIMLHNHDLAKSTSLSKGTLRHCPKALLRLNRGPEAAKSGRSAKSAGCLCGILLFPVRGVVAWQDFMSESEIGVHDRLRIRLH